jgi:glycosyltransferase involved in cell wall biosynthesis
MVRTTWCVYREALRQPADVYHFHNTGLILVGWLLKLHGKRVDVREDTPADVRDKYWIRLWARPTVAWAVDIAEKLSGRILDGIVARDSAHRPALPRLENHSSPEFSSARRGLSSGFPLPRVSPTGLYMGTITAIRGVLTMVDAMGLLPGILQARLAIAGEFEPAALEQEARQKPGWKRTDFAGWQNRRGLLDLLACARVGVVPFLTAHNHTVHNHMEAQPIKLF